MPRFRRPNSLISTPLNTPLTDFRPALLPLLMALAAAGLQAVPEASAAPAGGRGAWVKPVVSAPTAARAPIMIGLEPSEAACRKAWGDDWYLRCSTALGRGGTPAEGIRITPAVEGEWRWTGPMMLAFTPKSPWEPGRTYKVSLLELPVPLTTTIEQNQVTVETPPLWATSAHGRVWIDPDVSGERWVSFEYFFSTAPDRAKIEKAFSVSADKDSGARFAAPEFVWSEDGTSVYVKVKVITLPKEKSAVTATLTGVVSRVVQRNGRFSVPKGFEATKVTQGLPGEADLFEIRRASIRAVRNAGLSAEYEVEIASTLRMDAAKLLEKLRVLALPAKMSEDAQSNAVWSAAPVIDAEILSRSTPVKVSLAPGEAPGSERVKLRLSAPEGTFIYLDLPEGFGPEKTAGLSESWSSVLLCPKFSSSIEFLQPGSMLTLSGNWALSVMSTGVEKLRWRISRVRNEFLSLAAEGYDVMRGYTPDAWAKTVEGEIALGSSEPGKARFSSLDLSDAVLGQGAGLYVVEFTGLRNKDGKDEAVASATKKLLLTNIALISKTNADSSIDVFAAGFGEGAPQAGLTADLLARNGTVIESVQTDQEGRAHFKPTEGLEREKFPVAVTVRSKGTDMAWLSLTDASNLTNNFNWETGGRETRGANLAAWVFADRGIYRTGETVHFGLGVRSTDGSALPEGLPLEAKLTNDAGKVLATAALKLSAEGLAEFDWTVPEGTLPGRVKLDLFPAGSETVLATAGAFVSDYTPETLSLTAELPEADREAGWVEPAAMELPVKLTSQFGAGAEGRSVSGEIVVEPLSRTAFPGWDGWTFDSPAAGLAAPAGARRKFTLPSVATSGEGDAALPLPLANLSLTGFANARVSLTGLEAGGGDTIERSISFKLSPAEVALGWRLAKTPQPAWFLLAGDPAAMEFVVLDRMLAPKAGEKLMVTIERTRRVTELTADGSGRLTYTDTPVTEPVRTLELTTDASGLATLDLDTAAPGDMLVRITRADGTLLATLPYSCAGATLEKLAAGDIPSAEIRAKLEKTQLEAGDTARASVLSPFTGFGLLTLEANNVIASKWVKVAAGENLFEMPVPEGYAGRAWLRVSLIRGQESARKFLTGFTETALPLTLNTAAKRLDLTLEAPEKLNESRRVPVTVKSAKPSKVFLWAADDGILSLTGWRKPDPVKSLLEDRALEVKTRQTLSQLMPDASAVTDLTAPWGGDGVSEAAMAARIGNPFSATPDESAVWWGGLVETSPEGTTVEAEFPEGFSGRVRFFAAGASAGESGAAETASVIAHPVVIEPVLPSAVSPGDRFQAGAVVTPEKGGVTGALDITAPEGFTPGSAVFPLEFPEKGGIAASGEFTAPEMPGEAEFTFRALAGELTALRRASVGVRPASTHATRTTGGRIDTAKTKGAPAISIPTEIYPQDAETRFTVSASPAALALELGAPFALRGWDAPADAIAAAMPWAILESEPGAMKSLVPGGRDPKEVAAESEKLRAAAVSAIEGALARDGVRPLAWREASTFLTAYSLEYLLTAARTGGVPPELIGTLRTRLLENISTEPQTLDQARTTAYALWVLTREGTMTTEYLESLRASMEERFKDWQRDAAVAFLAASYQRLRLREEAKNLLAGSVSTARAAGDWTPETATVLAAAALAESGLEKTRPARLLSGIAREDFAQNLKTGAVSPVYAGAAALALMRGSAAQMGRLDLVCTKRSAGFPEGEDTTEVAGASVTLSAPGCTAVTLRGTLPKGSLWWTAEQTGWLKAENGRAPAAVKQGLEAERSYIGADGKPRTTFRTGERITVEVSIRASAGSENLTDVTVTDLLPGGLTYAMPAGTGPEGAMKFVKGGDRMAWLAPEITSWDPMRFTYTVRAACPGVYAVPPVEAASLSRPAVTARSAAGAITILPAEEKKLGAPKEAEPAEVQAPEAAAPEAAVPQTEAANPAPAAEAAAPAAPEAPAAPPAANATEEAPAPAAPEAAVEPAAEPAEQAAAEGKPATEVPESLPSEPVTATPVPTAEEVKASPEPAPAAAVPPKNEAAKPSNVKELADTGAKTSDDPESEPESSDSEDEDPAEDAEKVTLEALEAEFEKLTGSAGNSPDTAARPGASARP
ncbi:MG2 domain-containing protein [Sutterella sp.]|uniref:alpha-2-macroglobulin n=1 Tax=Sutterella sp. TaxID=1981025 RepID=UPI0026DEE45E|nr:MG2 domain-containing protein [Sutterella sp.]MDO5531786.1 MG2 domain-containing protein [Sutterella sp.]